MAKEELKNQFCELITKRRTGFDYEYVIPPRFGLNSGSVTI